MIESEKDNRGSKSDIYISVKEQRADGTGYLLWVFKVCSSGLEIGTIIIRYVKNNNCLNYKIARPV
jgi:hypothetical protein